MQIQMTGKNTEITDAIRSYAEKKLNRLNAMVDKISHIHLVFHVEKLNQIVEANISLPGAQIRAESSSEDMYESIDGLIGKIERQLEKYKGRITGAH